MRYVKALTVAFAVVGITATVASAQEYNRFGKGPTTVGLTPPGFNAGGGYMYQPGYRAAAPIVAAQPGERRSFSAEPSAPAAPMQQGVGPCNTTYAPAPAPAVANAPATGERRSFSAEPAAPEMSAPAVVRMPTRGVARSSGSSVENRFGKGPTTSGLTPGGR